MIITFLDNDEHRKCKLIEFHTNTSLMILKKLYHRAEIKEIKLNDKVKDLETKSVATEKRKEEE